MSKVRYSSNNFHFVFILTWKKYTRFLLIPVTSLSPRCKYVATCLSLVNSVLVALSLWTLQQRATSCIKACVLQ